MYFFKRLIAFLLFFTSFIADGQSIISIRNSIDGGYIGNKVSLFQDSSSSLTFEQILVMPEKFKNSETDVPNLGISHSTHWVKFTLAYDSNDENIILNLSNPVIDQACLFLKKSDGTVDSINYNNYTPIRKRAYVHQFYLFPIKDSGYEVITYYLKIKSNQQILLPITLESPRKVVSIISSSDIQTGIYLGIMIVMFLYNFFVYVSVKDKDYLIYCHYIFWVALTQATLLGFSHRFLWTDNIWMAQHMMTFCGAMSGIATILFAKVFLRTKVFTPKLNVALSIAIGAYVVAIIFLLSDARLIAYQMVNAIAVSGSILVITVAWSVYRQKYKPATYFLIGWSIFFASVILFVFKDYDIIPYNPLTIHSVEIGSALEAVFLSFALAGKINILKKEKEASQAEALAIAEENERIIREQNVVLEEKVKERTVELEASNNELNVTLDDLKQAQTQLVESEKMASLGQLTAGIAHEINNPINFVTSNVAPLQRDVNILMDTISMMETISQNEDSIANKKKQIEDYKEEIDYDYLKIEISHLLKGINEGASRTAEIVKGLRVFSRLDEDDIKFADINEGIESTLVIANNLLNGIKVRKELANLPLIECYPGKLNQVFLNIISNAVHAINKNYSNPAEDGELLIKTSINEEFVSIVIQDNGTGMSESTIKKIFEPFFTTKDVGEGTGLGMSIAYNTIKKHNGQINLHSELGKGTQFIVDLPIGNTKV